MSPFLLLAHTPTGPSAFTTLSVCLDEGISSLNTPLPPRDFPYVPTCSQSFFSLLISPVSLTFIMLSFLAPFHLPNAKPYMIPFPRFSPLFIAGEGSKSLADSRPMNSRGTADSFI